MPDIIISDIAMLLGKAVVAIFLSLLLNYVYIARISRLKKPSDEEMLDRLEITWQGGSSSSYSTLYSYGMQNFSGNVPTLPQQQKRVKNKKRGKAGGKRKLSRAERKKRNK